MRPRKKDLKSSSTTTKIQVQLPLDKLTTGKPNLIIILADNLGGAEVEVTVVQEEAIMVDFSREPIKISKMADLREETLQKKRKRMTFDHQPIHYFITIRFLN